MVPSVVTAVKFGARSPSCRAIVHFPPRTPEPQIDKNEHWRCGRDSNPRVAALQAAALTTSPPHLKKEKPGEALSTPGFSNTVDVRCGSERSSPTSFGRMPIRPGCAPAATTHMRNTTEHYCDRLPFPMSCQGADVPVRRPTQ